MLFFEKRKDGGPESNVTGFWLIEIKWLFSIVLLRFTNGTREAFHNHAFHAISWVLFGKLIETRLFGEKACFSEFTPSLKPIITTRDNLHKVTSVGTTWAITFRGPWTPTWNERIGDSFITLTNGRKVVNG